MTPQFPQTSQFPPAPASATKYFSAAFPPMPPAPCECQSPASAGLPNTKSLRKFPAKPAPAQTQQTHRATTPQISAGTRRDPPSFAEFAYSPSADPVRWAAAPRAAATQAPPSASTSAPPDPP